MITETTQDATQTEMKERKKERTCGIMGSGGTLWHHRRKKEKKMRKKREVEDSVGVFGGRLGKRIQALSL